ncbi:serine/threonine-protein kinase [Frankia sp. Cr2]|uniref:serine/threonine-protein kinase n=1 Tax=Frankia sp. Cr2 TaxID=3073932 RepID=UPI002AD2070E|nr:serine/threonine-protein kinase [Frankia sp. Cr2]
MSGPKNSSGNPYEPSGSPYEPLLPEDPRAIGPYRIMGRLGAGGMGRVYLGQSRSGLLVAVKTVRADMVDTAGFRARFAREAAAARQVSGVFTAAVVDADAAAAMPWLATAYVAAPSLYLLVRRVGPLPVRAVFWLAAGIAEALESIHRVGLIHRDLKPSNVLVTKDNPKVIDFGLVRTVDSSAQLTQTVIGTPQYMSPEQALDTSAVTPATDVYSLGATLLYAATGRLPYLGDTPVNVLAQLLTDPPDLSGVPAALTELIRRCTQRDPAARPTPNQLLEEIAGTWLRAPGGVGAEQWLPRVGYDLVDAYERRHSPRPSDAPSGPAEVRPRSSHSSQSSHSSRSSRESQALTSTPSPPLSPLIAVTPPLPSAEILPPPRDGGGVPADRRQPARVSRRTVLQASGAVAAAVGAVGAGVWGAARLIGGNTDTSGPRPWAFTCRDQVYSSPAVVDGVVYIGSDDSHLYAIDARTGQLRWSYQTGGAVTSSPAVADGLVYVGCNDAQLHAVNAATGQPVWTLRTGGVMHSSPAVADGVVYIGCRDNNLYAVDATTGRERWHFTGGDWFNSSPTVYGGGVYVGCRDKNIYALDIATGHPRWHFTTASTVDSSPAVSGETLWIGGDDHNVYALNTVTGALNWQFTADNGVVSTPLVVERVVYVGSDDGHLYALDANTGRVRWRFPTDNGIRSSPAVANDLVYVGSRDRYVYAVEAVTGKLRWRYATGAPVDDSSPAVVNGMVYIGSLDHRVYALNAATGAGP